MRKSLSMLFLSTALLLVTGRAEPSTNVRIKDIARVEQVRNNQLLGYGLVVGLDGTGDKERTQFTIQSLANLIERIGVTVDPSALKVKNVAAVCVTATLPPFVRSGSRIDVTVSSIGDAKSLQGGTLLMTPLNGANGLTYGVAQGAVSIGGFQGGGGGERLVKNHPTVGRIPGGALVEREVDFRFDDLTNLTFVLRNGDFTTARNVAAAINGFLKRPEARAVDARAIEVPVPVEYRGKTVDFLSRLENLRVHTDQVARVVMSERTGTIVVGENVRISTVAVSHGNLVLKVRTDPIISQPEPFSRGGETVVVGDSEISVSEEEKSFVVLQEGASIGDVVKALNAVGATPRDIVAIFQAIKRAGAIQAELEII